MPKLLRNLLALIIGFVVGGMINMAIVTLSPMLIPPPAGVDVTKPESLAASMHLFEARHFLLPWLAHALGTLVGALLAFLIAATHKGRFACAIGVITLLGGIAACFMIPAPAWFMAADLLLAYLPMSWLAIQIGSRMQRSSPA